VISKLPTYRKLNCPGFPGVSQLYLKIIISVILKSKTM